MVVVAISSGAFWWFRTPELVRCYARITGGLTVAEVREIVGREEITPDGRQTANGEFERSWDFSDGGQITVVFDPHGRSFYKEIGPADCGVTPLMDNYIEK